MSIIIHGMDVPKNEELWIRVQPDGKIVSQKGYVIEDASAKQIPPHGRFIDADALIRDLQYDIILDEEYSHDIGVPCSDEDKKLYQFDKDVKQNCIEFINATPTIIEAEVKE